MSSADRSPRVSVIIPAHNALQYLPKALESVWLQALAELEVIVVDDGSDDGSTEWLVAEADNEPRLRPLREEGIGVARARNRAIEQARAPLVAFLDADDWWYPGKLKAQVAFHEAHPELTLSFTDYDHVDPEGGDHGRCYAYWPRFHQRVQIGPNDEYVAISDGAAALLAENVVGTSTVVARRDAILAVEGFDTTLRSASDWELWLRLALNGAIAYGNSATTAYLMRPGSITSKALPRLEAMGEIIDRYEEAVAKIDRSAAALARGRLAAGYGEHFRTEGKALAALAAHLRALRLAPSTRIAKAAAADALAVVGIRLGEWGRVR